MPCKCLLASSHLSVTHVRFIYISEYLAESDALYPGELIAYLDQLERSAAQTVARWPAGQTLVAAQRVTSTRSMVCSLPRNEAATRGAAGGESVRRWRRLARRDKLHHSGARGARLLPRPRCMPCPGAPRILRHPHATARYPHGQNHAPRSKCTAVPSAQLARCASPWSACSQEPHPDPADDRPTAGQQPTRTAP